MRAFLSFLLAFVLVPVFAAPTGPASPPPKDKPLTVPNHGDFVGVRVKAYEDKNAANKKITIHPGVVVNGPHPDGKYDVAMISKNLPHNPPQQKITDFHPQSTAYGNVHLGPPKRVELQHMKPWKDGETGDKQAPMSPPNLANLKKAMTPHAGWRPPSPVPERPKTPPPRAGGSRIPIAKTYHVDKPANHPGGPSVASGSNSASWRKPAPKRQTTTNVGQKPAAERKPPVKQAGNHKKRSLRSR